MIEGLITAKSPERLATEKRMQLIREKRIRESRYSLWQYCKTESPDFYTEDNWHLKILCWVLQSLYEKKLTAEGFREICEDYAPEWFIESFDWDRLEQEWIYTKLIINMPPRTGKSRTLVNFCKWAFGRNPLNKIITGSYNDSMAQDFSRYTRDGIQEDKTYPHEIVYSDVFPGTKIKRGDASYGKWALEGSFFSYKGSGVGGSVTGKGCNISIVDDPVKDAAEAFNEGRLDIIWTWYASTFNSRLEKGGIRIVNMTRWAERDICGRLLDPTSKGGKRHKEWFVLKMTARDDVRENGTGEMLCPALLDEEMYEDLEDILDESIFDANYRQQPVDKRGRLYKEFKTYEQIPKDEAGKPLFESIISYTDTADTGEDYLACIVAGVYQGYAYVLDVLYTKEPMEVTEPQTAGMIDRNGVTLARFESNNGGRGFARVVQRLLEEKHGNVRAEVHWFHQSKNKRARIFTASHAVTRVVLFPKGWEDRWPEYYRAMRDYKAEGTNPHDDAADATTGIVEELEKQLTRVAKPAKVRFRGGRNG